MLEYAKVLRGNDQNILITACTYDYQFHKLLVFSSSSIVAAASLGYVFGRPAKPKTSRKFLSRQNSLNKSKNPIERFKLFYSKNIKNKNNNFLKTIKSPTTVHPIMVHLNYIVDDDTSSIYSDSTSICTFGTIGRKTIPELDSLRNLPKIWDKSIINDTFNSIPVDTLQEEDDEDWDTNIVGNCDSSRSKSSLQKLRNDLCESLPSSSVLIKGNRQR
ncbi:11386_t:CDS:2, partial [Scutellospora calospora]